MFSLRITEHTIKRGTKLVEILQDGEVVGAVYPTERGIKIVSRYLLENPESAIEIERDKLPPIPAVLINLIR
ncbi:MAG: hypothetical protein V1901_00995 [Patescibacteria group bacterium]